MTAVEMGINESALKDIFTLIKDLKFGEVIIKIQDSHIVAIEKHERIRLKKQADSASLERQELTVNPN